MGAEIGLKIGETRRRAQLSQDALALRSGVSVWAIRKLERGAVLDPCSSTLYQLARALGVSMEALLSETAESVR